MAAIGFHADLAKAEIPTMAKRWKGLFDALIAEGFDERESLSLVRAYVQATGNGQDQFTIKTNGHRS